MARIKIDLLPKQADDVKRLNKTVNVLMLVSRTLVLVFVVGVALVFGVFFYFQNLNSQVKAQVDAASANIEQSSQEELKYRLYQQILTQTDTIIKQRRDFRGIFQDLNALLPDEVAVRGLTFDEDIIIFDGSVQGVGSFGRLLDNFKKLEENPSERFTQVALKQVSRGADGSYTFRLEIGLTKS